jgi:hypothetical protein
MSCSVPGARCSVRRARCLVLGTRGEGGGSRVC